jgi:hypothetical protein
LTLIKDLGAHQEARKRHTHVIQENTNVEYHRDEKLLEKYGLKANDAILAEEKHMGLYEDLLQNHNAKLIAGGAAQNTARGAQVCFLRLRPPRRFHANDIHSTSFHQTPPFISAALARTSTPTLSPKPAKLPVSAQNTSTILPYPPAAVVW